MSLRLLGCAVLTAALAGCTLAPRYRPPADPEVRSFKEAGAWIRARPADTEARGPWWRLFLAPELDSLEAKLDLENPDVRAAYARYQQAQALARRALSDVFPELSANASMKRSRSSANAPLGALLGGRASIANDFVAGAAISWELDLAGRLRSAASAARATAEARAADLAAVQLARQAELASDYFSLRGADSTIGLLEAAVASYDHAYELTRHRYEQGVAAATDLDQAETVRQSARAQLAAARRGRAQLEHAIAVLLGALPSEFSLPAAPLAVAAPVVDPGLPSTLLQRRPDVASAERSMAAANQEIGVARAAWFPVLTLLGSGGYESVLDRTWLAAPSRFWSVGPAGQLPLLDAGSRIALNRRARAVYEEALESYRHATLTAFQEVEDNLAAIHYLADELSADEAAASSAKSSAYHAEQRYAAGVADYLEVTSTHTAALQAQRDAITARVAELNASVALVRATGGGWTRAPLAGSRSP